MQAILYIGVTVAISSLLTVLPLWFFRSLDKTDISSNVKGGVNMKKFAVSYYRELSNNSREIVSRETIKAVNKYEAKEVAEQHKPANADNYNIQDITGNY